MLRRMPEFAVTAIGCDRPGIVAAISEALLELEGRRVYADKPES